MTLAAQRPLRRNGWHFVREGERTILARQWPPQFDVAVDCAFPPARAGRLAHQIRQDLWRAFRGLRGFSPVIQIDALDQGLMVTAGGRLGPNSLPHDLARARIAALFDCKDRRARWLNWAQERST